MSWAEIKKAVNSDINIPLNDYVACGSPVIFGSPNSQTPITGTMLNINGKGRLNYFAFRNANMTTGEAGPKLKVTVDGNVVAYMQIKFASNVGNTGSVLAVVAKEAQDNDHPWTFSGGTNNYISLDGSTQCAYFGFSPSLQVHTATSSSYNSMVILSLYPILFTKSLKIELEGSSKPYSQYVYNYELLD
jgi:hypothetical protein